MAKTFIESFLEKEHEAKTISLNTLRKQYPGVKFKLVNIWCHGPLMEIDAGFSSTYLGDDGNKYEAHLLHHHPDNFIKDCKGKCVVYKFIQVNSYEYL